MRAEGARKPAPSESLKSYFAKHVKVNEARICGVIFSSRHSFSFPDRTLMEHSSRLVARICSIITKASATHIIAQFKVAFSLQDLHISRSYKPIDAIDWRVLCLPSMRDNLLNWSEDHKIGTRRSSSRKHVHQEQKSKIKNCAYDKLTDDGGLIRANNARALMCGFRSPSRKAKKRLKFEVSGLNLSSNRTTLSGTVA